MKKVVFLGTFMVNGLIAMNSHTDQFELNNKGDSPLQSLFDEESTRESKESSLNPVDNLVSFDVVPEQPRIRPSSAEEAEEEMETDDFVAPGELPPAPEGLHLKAVICEEKVHKKVVHSRWQIDALEGMVQVVREDRGPKGQAYHVVPCEGYVWCDPKSEDLDVSPVDTDK